MMWTTLAILAVAVPTCLSVKSAKAEEGEGSTDFWFILLLFSICTGGVAGPLSAGQALMAHDMAEYSDFDNCSEKTPWCWTNLNTAILLTYWVGGLAFVIMSHIIGRGVANFNEHLKRHRNI